MATDPSTIDDLLHRLRDAGAASARKMFGEYCLYLDGKPVALACDDVMYVKPTPAGRSLVPRADEGPPYPGAKPHLVLPIDAWSDADLLCRLVRVTFDALPAPKPKRARAASSRRRRGAS